MKKNKMGAHDLTQGETASAVPQADAEPDSPGNDFVLDIDLRAEAWRPFVAPLTTHMRHLVASLGLPCVEISLVLGDDALLAQLNGDYRGKNKPTNVLSFPALDADAAAQLAPGMILGDIVMSFDSLAKEAQQSGRALSAHAAHLLTHGLLHLLGYDHQTEAEAEIMERLETQLLSAAGLPDPYDETDMTAGAPG